MRANMVGAFLPWGGGAAAVRPSGPDSARLSKARASPGAGVSWGLHQGRARPRVVRIPGASPQAGLRSRRDYRCSAPCSLAAAARRPRPPPRPRPALRGGGPGARALRPGAPPPLAAALLAALAAARLDELHDAGPVEGRCPGDPACPFPLPRVAAVPQLDLAVILLDAQGRAVEAANVQLDPASPRGRVVSLDRNLAARDVRFRRWSADRRDGRWPRPSRRPTTWRRPRRPAPTSWRRTRPRSSSSWSPSTWSGGPPSACSSSTGRWATCPGLPPPGEPMVAPEIRPLREWMERMITESDNRATKAVLRHLHARGEVEVLNRRLRRAGARHAPHRRDQPVRRRPLGARRDPRHRHGRGPAALAGGRRARARSGGAPSARR